MILDGIPRGLSGDFLYLRHLGVFYTQIDLLKISKTKETILDMESITPVKEGRFKSFFLGVR